MAMKNRRPKGKPPKITVRSPKKQICPKCNTIYFDQSRCPECPRIKIRELEEQLAEEREKKQTIIINDSVVMGNVGGGE